MISNRWLIIVAVMSASLMQALDTTIVNVAMPHIQGAVGAAPDQISWTLTSYLIASAIVMPMTGYFTDLFGRRNYFLMCILGFTITSALCGAAQSLTQIVLYRLLQGAFGAGLIPLSQAVMADIYPKEELGKAMAIWGTGVMVGPILGPTLGGYLTDITNWRWVFYINIPVGIIAFIVAMQFLPNTAKIKRSVDWLGFVLIAIAIGATQYFLDRGNIDDWLNSTNIIIAMCLAFVSFIGFIIYSLKFHHENSVFHLSLFLDPNFSLSCFMMVVLGVGMFGTLVIQPLLLENLLHYPVLTAGLVMAPRGISCMVGLIIIGKYLKYLDLRIWIAGGIILSVIGMWFGTKYSLNVDLWWLILPMLLQGFGMGLILVPLSVIAFIRLPSSLSAEAAGLYNLLRVISSSIGIAITLTVFSRHTQIAWNHISHFVEPYNPHLFTYLQQLHLSIQDPKAIKLVASILSRQAQMLSFVDVFSFLMWSFIIMLPLVFLLRNPDSKNKNVGAGL